MYCVVSSLSRFRSKHIKASFRRHIPHLLFQLVCEIPVGKPHPFPRLFLPHFLLRRRSKQDVLRKIFIIRAAQNQMRMLHPLVHFAQIITRKVAHHVGAIIVERYVHCSCLIRQIPIARLESPHENHRRQRPLLPVDDILLPLFRIMHDNLSEEMPLFFAGHDGFQVIPKIADLVLRPFVITLIVRDAIGIFQKRLHLFDRVGLNRHGFRPFLRSRNLAAARTARSEMISFFSICDCTFLL